MYCTQCFQGCCNSQGQCALASEACDWTKNKVSQPAGNIAGGVIGAVIGVVIIISIIWWCKKRQAAQNAMNMANSHQKTSTNDTIIIIPNNQQAYSQPQPMYQQPMMQPMQPIYQPQPIYQQSQPIYNQGGFYPQNQGPIIIQT